MNWEEVVRSCHDSLARNPDDPATLRILGNAELNLGNIAAAQMAFERSLALVPNSAETIVAYAFSFIVRGNPARCIELLQPVVAMMPQFASAWMVLGNAYERLNEWAETEAAYRRVLAIEPSQREGRYLLANALLHRHLTVEAEAVVRQLLADHPDYADAWMLLGTLHLTQARAHQAISPMRKGLSLMSTPAVHSHLLLSLQYPDGVMPDQLLQAHRRWDEAFAPQPSPERPSVRWHTNRPLRLGLVSSDFRQHPTAYLTLAALESFDKSKCWLACYTNNLYEDAYTARFIAAADQWQRTYGMPADAVAELIRRDEIDVLVDLNGHTGSNQLPVFTRRPAPVQMTWCGYPGTTGLRSIDFLIADRWHVRPGEEDGFAEQILRMPQGYVCFGPPADAPAVGPLPALASGQITFGCFSNPAKFSSRMLDMWADILRRVKNSRLLLKFSGLHQSDLKTAMHRQFRQRNVAAERILLEGWSPHHELLAAYSRVDLALDTQPYSGGLTTCESLWMGVPVITYPGKTFAGRHATSHMSNAGYEQFVAADSAGYLELAIHWAKRLDDLATLRSQMREQVRRSPLCDAPRFAADLLNLLQGVSSAGH